MTYNSQSLFLRLETLIAKEPRLKLSRLSALLSVERHTLERVVRTEIGMSFRDYQAKRILHRALKLLETPELSIKEIAYSLNYRHPQDFSTFVRRHIGRSPSECRRQGLAFLARHRLQLAEDLEIPHSRDISP